MTAKVDIQALKITENDREVWKPEFKCEVGVSMPLKGKIRASTPAGLKMMANPNGPGYVIATDNYTFLDLLEEQPPEPPDGEEEEGIDTHRSRLPGERRVDSAEDKKDG